VGENPTLQPLQPEATGATVKATWFLGIKVGNDYLNVQKRLAFYFRERSKHLFPSASFGLN
jgi:hypothetical protein